MGSGSTAGSHADTAKRLAGRSLYAVGSGLVAGSRLVAKGVGALTADSSNKEPICFLKFALLEWGSGSSGFCGGVSGAAHDSTSGGSVGGSSSTRHELRRLPVLLVGLASGFQVWRLDGSNPAELLSRRDGPTKLVEAVPEPLSSSSSIGAAADELASDRPLLAVVPAPELSVAGAGAGGPSPAGATQQQQQQQQPQKQYNLLLYSLRSHGYVRSLTFTSEVLGVQASSRLLVVALRGQLQAFDACTLQHTFSCLTYTPPVPAPPPGVADDSARQQQCVTSGLASSSGSSDGLTANQLQQGRGAGSGTAPAAAAAAAALAPFALGPRWLAYASDSPVPQAGGQAVAQRLPLARRDSSSTASASAAASAIFSGGPDSGLGGGGGGGGSGQLGAASGADAGGAGGGLTKAAVADAALQAAAKGGQQLKAGLSAAGSASLKYLSQQYHSWRAGGQPQQQRDLDAAEADAAVAGTVVVRDVASRLPVAHFRAHTSPLAALQFSPGGTLLASASVAGHSINVFRVVPAASSGSTGGGTAGGHAAHLYRLHRGVTPAAILGISFAPDAAWVAVSSGRGSTHLFHTPAAAPGARPQQQLQRQQSAAGGGGGETADGDMGETGVAGRPARQPAMGRARKAGLLSSGVAGAAMSAARNLYSGGASDAAPISAAFLAVGPGSPRGAAAGSSSSSDSSSSSSSSLYVVTSDGLLSRHLLRAAAPEAASTSRSGAAAGSAPPGPAAAAGATAGTAAAAAVLEEADRWDVARQASWPEREELLPGVLLPQPSTDGEAPGPLPAGAPPAPASHSPSAAEAAAAAAAAAAEQQQLWVAQAESGPHAAPGPAAPLWQDPQFRFYELEVQQLAVQLQRSSASSPAGAALLGPGPTAGEDALAPQLLEAAGLGGGGGVGDGGGAAGEAWLESILAHPVLLHPAQQHPQ